MCKVLTVISTWITISLLFATIFQQVYSYEKAFQSSVLKDNFYSEIDRSTLPVSSKSILQVCNGANGFVNVYLESSEPLTAVNIGQSTLVRPPPSIRNKIDPNLLNLTDLVVNGYLKNNRTNVLISITSAMSAQRIIELTNENDLTAKASIGYVSKKAQTSILFASAYVTYSTILNLVKSDDVNSVWLDRKFKICLDQSVGIIKDPTQWANIEQSLNRTLNGAGVKIAILDTGIDSSHLDFYFTNGTSKILAARSFTGESVSDGYGHGTHCASIAAGTGAASMGRYKGVAPEAKLLNAKVLDNTGEGSESQIIGGIQWAIDNDADILSMSFGALTESNGTDPLSTTVNWATQQGAICVVAAGNSGYSGLYSIATPGTSNLAITVGASTKGDVVADFSSQGPTADYRIKPDVVAPGVDIVAARAQGTSMGSPISEHYTRASGTSMATPHIAGAAALLLNVYPTWNPETVKRAITNCAKDIGSNVCGRGSGRIDICESAVLSVIGNSSVSFGRTHLNGMFRQKIVFKNLVSAPLSLTLDAQVWLIVTHMHYQAVSLNTSSLHLTSSGLERVELTLNTAGLSSGYYEGEVGAIFDDKNLRIPLFFCILSTLECEVLDEQGSKLEAFFALVDAQSGESRGNSYEGTFIITTPGEYIVQALNIYGLRVSSGEMDRTYSFLVHKRVAIGSDETRHVEMSLSSAYKVEVRSTDLNLRPIEVQFKRLFTPYYSTFYFTNMGLISKQYMYLTNISEYIDTQSICYFGYMGFDQDDINWQETNILTSTVDAYFIGWNLSGFGLSSFPTALIYSNPELATVNMECFFPKYSSAATLWFNEVTGMWQSGFWYGFQTHPGIRWRCHILPCSFKEQPSADWALTEWSCIYTLASNIGMSPDYFLVDRHFQPITKGEVTNCFMGQTPILPQHVYENTSYYGNGLIIPTYPLRLKDNVFIGKTNPQDTKKLEVFKNGALLRSETKNWAQDPIWIKDFLNSYGYGLYVFRLTTDTCMDLCSQNVAEYQINYSISRIDLLPPVIENIECSPCFIDGIYHAEIEISDHDAIESISLQYSQDNNPWTSSPLTYLGNGRYSTEFAVDAATQKISLEISSSDTNGNAITFTMAPVAKKGYETQLTASIQSDRISGKLTVVGSNLLQQVYLKVKSDETEMYTLTDSEGNFGFAIPPFIQFPLEIEMVSMGPYVGNRILITRTESHDIAIVSMSSQKTIVSQGYVLDIDVTVTNEGNSFETSTLIVYANLTVVASKNIVLAGGASIVVSFEWNTGGNMKSIYGLSAYAVPVSGETDFADNTYIDGWIRVVTPGDLNSDNIIDIFDLVIFAASFGSRRGSSDWNPNVDIVNDGEINIFDLAVIATNFGKTWTP